MTREEIMALDGRELDGEIAEQVFGYTGLTSGYGGPKTAVTLAPARALSPVPLFSKNSNDTSHMEKRIQALEIDLLEDYYLLNLLELVYTEYPAGYWRDTSHYFTLECFAAIRFATPADCCRAALLALKEAMEEAGESK